MTRQAVGLDLNGWRDHACRDWEPDQPDARLDAPVVLDGGARAVVVEHEGRHIGGPEAILSPIGRGGGWGPVGDTARRRLLADHWSHLVHQEPGGCFDADMRAAAAALSHGATHRVVCIPDHAGFGEQQQKRLLQALGHDRGTPPVLVWRSVALLLGLLETGLLGPSLDGMRVACLIHGPEGIERQVLVLRALPDHPGRFAPERAGPGQVVCPGVSLTAILGRARDAIATANRAWDEARTGPSRLAADLLFRDERPENGEIMRAPNADWIRLLAPAMAPALGEAGPDLWPQDVACSIVLSPLAGHYGPALRKALFSTAHAGRLVFAAPHAAAAGALVAARRIEKGIPHYLDRLEPMAMAVLRGATPTFEELIPAHTVVPGNREYVSPPLTGFRWAPDQSTATFYVRKGTTEIRRWTVQALRTVPDREQRLVAQVRQMPAQGWASLSLSSDTWDTLRHEPIRLHWDDLERDGRPAQQILDELRGLPPVVPQRIHYPGEAGLWDGSLRKPGLSVALAWFAAKRNGSLGELRKAVSYRWSRPTTHPLGAAGPFYPVDTDGTLPGKVDQAAKEAFHHAVDEVADDLLRRVRDPGAQVVNNEALLFLTWIFAACPAAVRDEVLRAFQAMLERRDHKLLHPRGAEQVVRHGLGRIASDRQSLEHLLPLLLARLPDTEVLAPVSTMLSRPEATPGILNGPGVNLEEAVHGVRKVVVGLLDQNSFGHNYSYALLSLIGLLRVRERQPRALMAETSPAAQAMAKVLERGVRKLEHALDRRAPNKQLQRKLDATREGVQLLTTSTGRPDILSLIDSDDDG